MQQLLPAAGSWAHPACAMRWVAGGVCMAHVCAGSFVVGKGSPSSMYEQSMCMTVVSCGLLLYGWAS
jgi:hypothetical protein